jgi:antitoxin YefM
MTIITPSGLRNDIYNIINEVIETNAPIFIKSKNKDAVLMSGADYRSMQETMYLQSIPGMVESIQEGMKEPLENCKPFVFD